MSTFLAIVFTVAASYSVLHYALSSIWNNRVAIIAISTVFAVLCAIFLPLVGTALLSA